ncbi:MAG: hypothetical protein Q9M30_03500, partial [Mariprofundaceae bacterium]|nr:hypothetical protein [Mariprofundaceae bacterium]
AYSHCIAHGFNLEKGMDQQKAAVDSGTWLLYRYDPRRKLEHKNPLILDSKKPKIAVKDYAYNETRFKMLTKYMPERARELLEKADKAAKENYDYYQSLASLKYSTEE